MRKFLNRKEKRIPIGIEDVCKIIGKAKPTIYTLVRETKNSVLQKRKKLYFLKMNFWNGFLKVKKTLLEIESEALKYHNRNR